MKKTWWIIGVAVVLLVAGFLSYRAVAGSRSSTTTALQTATVQRGTITAGLNAAGTVRAGQSAIINWQTSGKVGEIKVNLGDQVQANQELAALDSNSLAPSTINAKQNLIDAKKALDDLLNSKLQQAQALQAVQDAQKALDGLQQTSAETSSQAQLTLATAQKARDDAQRKRNAMNYAHSTDPLVIENAQTDYLLAKAAYKDAFKEYSRLAHKKLTNTERAAALKKLLAAQQKMESTLGIYNWYLLNPSGNDIAQADGELAVAQASLDKAQADWDSLKNGPDAATVATAQAKLADAQRAWERVKDGPNPDDIAAAQAAVDSAQASLDQVHLQAPFAGTVTRLDDHLGDLVSSGSEAFRIDDLSSIFIDLQVSEVDINNLQVGQQATLTFDAIPNKTYAGKVTEIGVVGNVAQGVVNYPVTIQITNPDSVVKSGMTAAVTVTINAHDNVLMVPNQAIRAAGNQRTVTVLFEGQQIPVPVTVGLSNETMSEVTGNQIQEGDEVVINSSAATSTGNQSQGGRGFPGGGPGFILR